MRRWLPLLVALLVAAAMTVGTAVAVGNLGPGRSAPPRLTRVPPGTIAQWGVRLTSIPVPPYCAPLQAAADGGVSPQGIGHCPVSKNAAVAAAQRGGAGAVLETDLASITLDHSMQIPRNQPAWIVLLRFQPSGIAAFGGCRPDTPGCSGAPGFGGELAQIVIVDAYTGRVLLDIPVMPNDGKCSNCAGASPGA